MQRRKVKAIGRSCSFIVVLWVLLAAASLSGLGPRVNALEPTPTPSAVGARRLPLLATDTPSVSSAPGYCPSYGGWTDYEYVSSVTLTSNPDGTMKLAVQVYIANPTGCTVGQPCPDYDVSPEYVNAWIDWDGDRTWEASERVMDKALTGYLAINYHGTMTSLSQFSPPPSVTNQPTWLRVNLGWGDDPNNPCEESWAWGNVVDKQVHLEKPVIKEIMVRGVGTDNDNPETGSPVRLEANIDVPTGYQVTECSWTGHLTPGKGNATSKCRYEYTPATGPGPAVNTYGEKEVNLTITYRHTPSGATGQVSKKHTYRVFFNKYGDDDGDCGDWHWPPWEACEPNWFEYWGDDGAVDGLTASDVVFDPTLPANWAGGYFGDDRIHFGNRTAMVDGQLIVPGGTDCPGGTFPGAAGIDLVAISLAHERRHKVVHHNWDSGGEWDGWADSDEGVECAACDDDLPDAYEISTTQTATDTVDSCGFGSLFPNSNYDLYGDQELDARRAELGVSGNDVNDWANPGKQTTPPYGVSAIVGMEVTRSSAASVPGEPSAHYSEVASSIHLLGIGSLTGSYSDVGVDTDADGLYDSLRLSVGIRVDKPAEYGIFAWLEDGTGTEIAWASASTTEHVGVHTVDLLFEGIVIRAFGVDGPYNVAHVELRTAYGEQLVDEADDVHTTSAYEHADFDSQDVAFAGSFSDMGVDTSTDGEYDLLRISVGLDVQEPGSYTIVGELEGSEPIAVASTTASLSAGGQSVTLDFDGRLIFQHRQDGPYQLKALRVEDAVRNRIVFLYDAYTTSSYSYGQFQHGGTTLDASTYADQAMDMDDDGDYDYLRLAFQVDVGEGGEYRILATLQDSDAEVIDRIIQDLDFVLGANPINLDIAGGAIYDHGVDGPYQLTSVALLDAAGNILDHEQMAHTTQAYSYSDFSPLLVSLTGEYEDYGEDIDGDGLYDCLNIDIGVIPGDAGVIVAQGLMVDSTGQEIQWAESLIEMGEGSAQTITLCFAGPSIWGNGTHGPFELRNLLVYHTGDPAAQGVSVSWAHTTAAYSYLDFDRLEVHAPLVMKNF